MLADRTILQDVQSAVAFGMNCQTLPKDLPFEQYAGANNIKARGGPVCRNGFRLIGNMFADYVDPTNATYVIGSNNGDFWTDWINNDTTGELTASVSSWNHSTCLPDGAIQCAVFYNWLDEQYGMLVIDGNFYILRISTHWMNLQKLATPGFSGQLLDPELPIFTAQAQQFMLFQDGVNPCVVWNGMSLRQVDNTQVNSAGQTIPEVPTGTAMVWCNNRLWVASGRFVHAGDILGGATSPISFSEEILQSGGPFEFPQTVIGLAHVPMMDTSTGQGELVVGLQNEMHTLNSENQVRSTWTSASMQHVLFKTIGLDSHFSFTNVTTDLYWRFQNNIFSYRNSRLGANPYYINMLVTANRPANMEVQNYFPPDRPDLLNSARGVYFDGRLYQTVYHSEGTFGGIVASGMVVMDMLTTPIAIQSGGSTAPTSAIWDGLYYGIQPACFLSMVIDGNSRTFALCSDEDGVNRCWEFSKNDKYDEQPFGRVPIEWLYDTRAYSFGDLKAPKRLLTVDQSFSQIVGKAKIGVSYRPDGADLWTPWGQLTTEFIDTLQPGEPWERFRPGHLTRIRPETPGGEIETDSDNPSAMGHYFQLRYEGEGHSRIDLLVLFAKNLTDAPSGANGMTKSN